TTVNGKPDVTKLGVDYAYADENGVYTILGSEIRRVMKLDSYCQQVYGYVPKYTFFRKEGSNGSIAPTGRPHGHCHQRSL
ncbi:MAG: hypothetical protein IIW93_05360, partial [Bacteroidaceae bacterium]|nr:hypothetical protein [Bacteroidaceae bacterium]